MTALATDNFNRTENPLSDGGNWSSVTSHSAMAAVSAASLQYAAGNAGADCASRRSGTTWPNDQYSELKVTSNNFSIPGAGLGVAIRIASAAATLYRVVMDKSGNWEMGKTVAGAFTSLLSGATTYSAGTYLYLEAQGTTIVVKYGGSTLGTKTDASISSGQAGVFYSSSDTGATADDWEGGDFAGAASAGFGVPRSTTFHPGNSPGGLTRFQASRQYGQAISTVFRRSLSEFGSRTGSRQPLGM